MNLRELATVTPTYFFSHVSLFFDNIFIAINDPKIRDSAVSALRSALYVVSERERVSQDLRDNKSRIDQQIPNCFKTCFDEVKNGFDERDKSAQKERDDKIQASLLILNELLRCSNDSGISPDNCSYFETNILYSSSVDIICRELEYKYNQIIESQSNTRSSQLSRLFRSHSNIQTHPTVPSYGLRDLNSVVKYHKEMGIAPVPSSQHK